MNMLHRRVTQNVNMLHRRVTQNVNICSIVGVTQNVNMLHRVGYTECEHVT